MLLSKIDKNLNKHQSDNEQDEHRDRDESSQQALLSDKGITDDSQLNLVRYQFVGDQDFYQFLTLLILV